MYLKLFIIIFIYILVHGMFNWFCLCYFVVGRLVGCVNTYL